MKELRFSMYFSACPGCFLGRSYADIGTEVGQSVMLEKESITRDNQSLDGWFPHCCLMGHWCQPFLVTLFFNEMGARWRERAKPVCAKHEHEIVLEDL